MDVDTLMVSDGLAGFLAAGAQVTHHQRVVVHPRKSSELDCFHWISRVDRPLLAFTLTEPDVRISRIRLFRAGHPD
ncbi:hypothetical protein [Thiolapillus sp.]|uniref:hypothetical protein n=1 Tax=Thiolapillus sp. TaxID=2017437 RepID=UPI0025F06602|nr:hypothetical protein [Thiolapillus sp.]